MARQDVPNRRPLGPGAVNQGDLYIGDDETRSLVRKLVQVPGIGIFIAVSVDKDGNPVAPGTGYVTLGIDEDYIVDLINLHAPASSGGGGITRLASFIVGTSEMSDGDTEFTHALYAMEQIGLVKRDWVNTIKKTDRANDDLKRSVSILREVLNNPRNEKPQGLITWEEFEVWLESNGLHFGTGNFNNEAILDRAGSRSGDGGQAGRPRLRRDRRGDREGDRDTRGKRSTTKRRLTNEKRDHRTD